MSDIHNAILTDDELDKYGYNKHSRSDHSSREAARRVAQAQCDKLHREEYRKVPDEFECAKLICKALGYPNSNDFLREGIALHDGLLTQ